jgi:probable O-glycosylation ligase (exosortase A-associated)
MIFFYAVVIYVNSFERLRTFFYVWMLIMIILAARGIAGKGIGGSSFLSDENDFSLLMNIMLPFGLFLFMYERSFKRKLLYLTASVLAIISIVLSFSRGGFVGLIAVLTVVWLFSPRKILSLFIVLLLILVLYNVAGDRYWDRIHTITATNEGTAKERIDSWKAGWNMFLDNPLGVGGGNFPVRFSEYQPPDMPRGMYGRAAHSFWFTLISETGIPGIVLFILITAANLRDINWIRKLKTTNDDDIKFARYLSLAFIASFCGFFVSGTFITVNYYPHFYYLTAMIVVTRRLVNQRKLTLGSI